MKTITFHVPAESVPAGSLVRAYHTDDSEFVAEATSDGSGVIVMTVDDKWHQQFQLTVLSADGPGASGSVEVTPSSVDIS